MYAIHFSFQNYSIVSDVQRRMKAMTFIQSVTVEKRDNTINITTSVQNVLKDQRAHTRIVHALMKPWYSVTIETDVNHVPKEAQARYQIALAIMEQVRNSISK